ncbi:MAG: hypothetical protein LVQ95_03720 [Candidatus Micrarchaeales archaeon]|nr:hypothetical protein [Candidatus Micrarchaeales archaeon]
MNVDMDVSFTPQKLRAFSRNEVRMEINLKNLTESSVYWGECEIVVASPLSLAHDIEMNTGKTRIGILKPMGYASKIVKLYTRPNNYPDDYKFKITAYIYDEDGAIAERFDKNLSIECMQEELAKEPPVKDKDNKIN